ncbi:MAG: Bax inhibitor-1 family protein [Deltaproteobacteria bacterium]|nr:Bax inhibitor-1 family protein [Deltaproteobacteria bacterium]
MSWETTVSTGNAQHDQMMIDAYRQQARASGMDLQVQPMPSGGYHVRAVPMQQAQHAGWQQQPAYAAAGAASVSSPTAAAEIEAAKPLSTERLAYLRKVYGLLSIAAFLAIGSGYALLELSPTAKFLYQGKKVTAPIVVVEMWNNPVLMYAAFGALVATSFVASWLSKVKVINVIMLMLVAVLMGVELAPMAMIAQLQAGMGKTLSAAPVRDAFMMVGAIFAGVTAYVFISRKDFSWLGAIVSMGTLVVLVGCILTFVLDSEIFTLAVASVGALLAGLFLMWQTWWVLKGDMDDPIEDALVFLVQLRNLFMFLLRIFMSRD